MRVSELPPPLTSDDLTVRFACNEEGYLFAHLWSSKGVFGCAKQIKQLVPVGAFITVGPKLQPGITWYLTHKAGFRLVETIDGVDLLVKE